MCQTIISHQTFSLTCNCTKQRFRGNGVNKIELLSFANLSKSIFPEYHGVPLVCHKPLDCCGQRVRTWYCSDATIALTTCTAARPTWWTQVPRPLTRCTRCVCSIVSVSCAIFHVGLMTVVILWVTVLPSFTLWTNWKCRAVAHLNLYRLFDDQCAGASRSSRVVVRTSTFTMQRTRVVSSEDRYCHLTYVAPSQHWKKFQSQWRSDYVYCIIGSKQWESCNAY